MPGSLWSPKLTELISQLLLWHYEFALQIWKCKHDRYVTPDNGTETCSKHDDSSAIFLNTCQANDLPPAARPAKSFALRVPIIQKQKVAQVTPWKCLCVVENCISKVLLPVWNFTFEASSNFNTEVDRPPPALYPQQLVEKWCVKASLPAWLLVGLQALWAQLMKRPPMRDQSTQLWSLFLKSHIFKNQIPLVFNQLAIYRPYLKIWSNGRLKMTTPFSPRNTWPLWQGSLSGPGNRSHWGDNASASILHQSDERCS